MKLFKFQAIAAVMIASTMSYGEVVGYKDWKNYVLDPLLTLDGRKITTVKEWETIRRPEILKQFVEKVCGKMPEPGTYTNTFKVVRNELIKNGTVRAKTARLTITGPNGSKNFDVPIWLPISDKPVPVIMLCNHSTDSAEGNGDKVYGSITDDNFNNPYLPVPMILSRGYGVVVYNMNMFAPTPTPISNWEDELYSLFNLTTTDTWRYWGVWAFGGMRVIDYLVTDPDIDISRIATIGHSRSGCASQWIGVLDQRVSLCINNEGPTGGASLWAYEGLQWQWKINFSLDFMIKFYPIYPWATRPDMARTQNIPLPVDGNLMIALMAPRLYALGTAQDGYAKSEYLLLVYSQPVWNLYGLLSETWKEDELPATVKTTYVRQNGRNIHFHFRRLGHGLKQDDWDHYLNYADTNWKTNTTGIRQNRAEIKSRSPDKIELTINNGVHSICFSVQDLTTATDLRLDLFTLQGRYMHTLFSTTTKGGRFSIPFDKRGTSRREGGLFSST